METGVFILLVEDLLKMSGVQKNVDRSAKVDYYSLYRKEAMVLFPLPLFVVIKEEYVL